MDFNSGPLGLARYALLIGAGLGYYPIMIITSVVLLLPCGSPHDGG